MLPLALHHVAYERQLAPLGPRRHDPLDLRALALPAITPAIATIPFYLRVSRATTLDTLAQRPCPRPARPARHRVD